MKVPKTKKLKIGSSWYDIKYVDDLRDEQNRLMFGQILQGSRLIKINKERNSFQNMLQTLYHESEHGVMWEYGVDDVEDLVESISNGNFAFIIDNPEFIREILKLAERIKKC